MPVKLRAEDNARWLDTELVNAEAVRLLVDRSIGDEVSSHAVSRRVGSSKNEGPELIEPVSG